MSSKSKTRIGALIAGSLLWSSAAMAGSAVPSPQPNPWAVLSAMSGGAPAAALCGAAAVAAAAQAPNGCVLPVMDAAPPVAAPQGAPLPIAAAAAPVTGAGISPLLFALLAIAAGAGAYFALHHSNNRANSPA